MNHWIIVPIVLPAIMAAFLVLVARFDLVLARSLSIGATGLLLGVTGFLFLDALGGAPQAYLLGNWPAPFGIVLVLDRLSALMLLLTAILAIVAVVYAALWWDRQGRHFHALFQFQLMGVNGAFLTGDIFNLFVFFEVLLIASYGLMLHGGGRQRFQAGIHYVVINLIASTLFLFAVGLIYAVVGTLNMADLARAMAGVPPENAALLRTGALLLLAVFAVKAAVVPLHFWLPGAYAAASPPVAALFAIMTKVGAYSIIRVFTLIFGADGGPAAGIAGPWLLPAALATAVLGSLGVLAARDLSRLVAWALIASMGTLLVAIAIFTRPAVSAALYYLVNSTLATAALFLLVDIVGRRRGGMQDRLEPAPPIRQQQLVAGLFFLAAIAIVGLPPLAGYVGKVLVLQAAEGAAGWGWIWAVVLVSSFAMLLAFGRAGSTLFWKSAELQAERRPSRRQPPVLPVAMPAALLLLLVLFTAASGPAMRLFDDLAAQLMSPGAYISAVLGEARAAVEPQP